MEWNGIYYHHTILLLPFVEDCDNILEYSDFIAVAAEKKHKKAWEKLQEPL